MHEVNVRIYRTAYGGSEFEVQPKVLHLGGMWAAKVDQLRIELPEEWKGKALTLHIQRKSGALPTPLIVNNQDGTVAVTGAFTAEDSGLWMVMAVGSDGYKAMSRPAQYVCYETINISGEEEIPQTMYEKFVAQVLDSANAAAASAQEASKTKTEALGQVGSAKTDALAAITASKQDALGAVQQAQTAAVKAVTDNRTAAVKAVRTAQDTATGAVTKAQTTATAAVEKKGEEVLATIPEDYTDTLARVDALESCGFVVVDGKVCMKYVKS